MLQLANRNLPNARQTLLLSASLPPEVQRLASHILAPDHVRVTVGVGSAVATPSLPNGTYAASNAAAGVAATGSSGAGMGAGGAGGVEVAWDTVSLPPAHLITQRLQQVGAGLHKKLEALDELLADHAVQDGAGGGSSRSMLSLTDSMDETSGMQPVIMQPPTATVKSSSSSAASASRVMSWSAMRPTIIFTNSLARAGAVQAHLAGQGASVALLHRDLTQDERDEAINCFKYGVTPLLVATGLAARGLDFPDVGHVINFDMPHMVRA